MLTLRFQYYQAYSASQSSPPVLQSLRSVLGLSRPEEKELPTAMTMQERLDFGILVYGFGVLVAM